ncbi:polysaccharide biosynthesis tyrosine autokinase [Psychrobacter sp. DM8]|uniref:polysaccharide biosynthesis tyrosine autokinase n=1 Tax=Psychrobacter sp. DM8 TaxID=3440636 RepID=UPI003F5041A1
MKIDSNKNLGSVGKQNSSELDLLSLFDILRREWKIILFFVLLGLVSAILYSRYVTPIYQADALIQVDDNSQGVSGLGENISDLIDTEESKSQAETELIKSRMVLDPVVSLLHLQIRLSNPTISTVDKILSDNINTQLNTTNDVSLQTNNGSAKIGQFEVAEEYLDQPFTLMRSGSGFTLSNAVDEFTGQLNVAEQFKGTNGDIQITVLDLPNTQQPIAITKQSIQFTTNSISNSLKVVEKGDLSGIIQLSMTGTNQQQVSSILREIVISYVELSEARSTEETTKTVGFMETQIPVLKQKLEDSEGVFNKFRERYGTIDVGREAELLLTENAQIDTQLNELKLNKAELTTYYTNEHPLVIQINDQLRVLNDRKQVINNTVAGLPEIQREFLKLSEDVAINREIYLTMLKNYEQLKIVEAGQTGYARIVDLPVDTYIPIAPNKTLILLAGLLFGALLGIMSVLLRHLIRSDVKDPNGLEDRMGVPVLAMIPRSQPLKNLIDSRHSTGRLLTYIDKSSLSYEAIKSLRTYLMLGQPATTKARAVGADTTRSRVILITGESPNGGKSFITANLAEVFSHLNKKILVIDADMRMGNLHSVFAIEHNFGLSEYFNFEADSASSITHVTAIDNIDFIPRGHNAHDPSSWLASDRFSELMAQLIGHYDYIIIDSPPVLAASDAVIISQYADTVLMVTKYNDPLEEQLAYAIKQMEKANTTVDGIVINDMQQSKKDKRSYYYNYEYGSNS